MHLKEGEQHVDDVSSALKRFLRDLPDGLFTRAQRLAWLEASGGSCCLHPAFVFPTSGRPRHTLDKACPSSPAYCTSQPSSHTLQRWGCVEVVGGELLVFARSLGMLSASREAEMLEGRGGLVTRF